MRGDIGLISHDAMDFENGQRERRKLMHELAFNDGRLGRFRANAVRFPPGIRGVAFSCPRTIRKRPTFGVAGQSWKLRQIDRTLLRGKRRVNDENRYAVLRRRECRADIQCLIRRCCAIVDDFQRITA